jgi:L-lactate dehydrogenase (cytochrome)
MGILGRAHDEAEVELLRGLVRHGVHAVISTMSTRTAEEIVATLEDETMTSDKKGGTSPPQLHFQLYTPPDRTAATRLIRRAREAGFRSLWVTVDTPVLGKRTIDRRRLAEDALTMGLEEQAFAASLGIRTHVPPSQISPSLG